LGAAYQDLGRGIRVYLPAFCAGMHHASPG
jgi:hypothetical protein